MDYGTYAGTALVRYLAQIQPSQFKSLTSDALLNNFIRDFLVPHAEKVVDGYCNHSFGTPSYGTVELDGMGKSSIFFPPQFTPILGVSAGSVGSTAITVTDLKIYEQFIRWDGGSFTEGKKNVVFYGSFGYLDKDRTPVVPKDVEYVTAHLAANMISDMIRRGVQPDAFANIRAGQDDLESSLGALFASPFIFTKNLKEMLEEYVIVWVDVG